MTHLAKSQPDRHHADKAEVQQTRVSVTFPPEQYRYLRHVARTRRVSLAWVVRDAVEHYMDSKTPLFPHQQ